MFHVLEIYKRHICFVFRSMAKMCLSVFSAFLIQPSFMWLQKKSAKTHIFHKNRQVNKKNSIKSERQSPRSYLSIAVPKCLPSNSVGVFLAWRRGGWRMEGESGRAEGPRLTCGVLNSEGSHSCLPLTTRPGLDGLDTGG